MYALSVCEDERLKLAINLSFSCSLRLGELLGLTWDCVDISPEAIEENRSYVFINKESQRIRKESLDALDGKDVLLVFPTNHKKNSTVRILKTPKTESRVRKIFLPKSVANMLVDWKAEQDEMKEILGDEYMDYNLVMASTFGLPLGDGAIRGPLKKLIEDYNLPPVVFHSFRHSSVTYKLKLNGGDIKAGFMRKRIWIHRCMYSRKIIMQLLLMKSIRNFWQKCWQIQRCGHCSIHWRRR